MKLHRLCATAIVSVTFASAIMANASFIVGHYFDTTTGGGIVEYDASGLYLGGVLASGGRGIAFGPDGLLYTVDAIFNRGFEVRAYDSNGVQHQSYQGLDDYYSNLDYGHIAVGPRYIYTSGTNNVTRFDTLNPRSPGITFFSEFQTPIYDLDLLPNGNLMVASVDYVEEVAPDGTPIRGIPYRFFNNVRGVAYDPTSNAIFVSEVFGTSADTRFYKFDYTTLSLLATSSTAAGDLFRTMDGNLLVAGGGIGPQLYDTNLNPIGSNFGGNINGTAFVTQFTPEPAPMACTLIVSLACLLGRRTRIKVKAY